MKIKRSIKHKLPKDERLPQSTTYGRIGWYLILVGAFFATGVYAVLHELQVPETLAIIGAAGLVYLLLTVFLNNLGRKIR
jgi:hypothetical protein